MEELFYEKPSLNAIAEKPVSEQNDPFPYHKIKSPDDFEALVYAIYKTELGKDNFIGFDNISLLTGGRDKGRDCVLTRNGKNYGLIQCKRYEKNLNINDVGMEITKFAMYSLLQLELIHASEDFTYFIAAASNFEHRCSNFIDDFNQKATEENLLSSWVNKLLLRPELKQLALDPPLEKIKALFTKLRVIKILPVDMSLILSRPENAYIINYFFKSTLVMDNSHAMEIKEILGQRLPKALDHQEIRKQLKGGSFSLSCEQNEFDGIRNSHIPRAETTELVDWITNPAALEEKTGNELNICLLSAGAGMGKTVIIKDLYDALIDRKIPVLALKADKLYATSIKELQDNIGLSVSVFDFIDKCKQEFPMTVLLIDQIDALSQSLSSKREYLNTYIQLIEYCKFDSSIRIVMSVRVFDLLYDPTLRRYKNWKSIMVQPLTVEQTKHQLIRIGLSEQQLSESFVALMRTPNNLNIFSRIYRKGFNFSGIDSVQKLYEELWNVKISKQSPLSGTNFIRLSELLYKIVDDMYEGHKISVTERHYEHFSQEINYLKSEHLLKSQENELQFFHQTFYDYLFAKRFTQGKTSLSQYIKQSGQSIKTRAAVKMILNFLRDDDHKEYLKLLTELLSSKHIYFHLKHLMISSLAAELKPTFGEKELLLKVIKKDYHQIIVFTDYVNSANWVNFMIKNKLLDCLTKTAPIASDFPFAKSSYRRLFSRKSSLSGTEAYIDSCAALLKRNLRGNEASILSFLRKVKSNNTVRWLLYNLKAWDNPIAYELFELVFHDQNKDYEGYFMVLEDIANENPGYVLDRIKNLLTSFEDKHKRDTIERRESALTRKLMEKIPEQVIPCLETIVIKEADELNYKELNGKVLVDYHFTNIRLKSESPREAQNIYATLAEGLAKHAEQKSVIFRNFYNHHQKSLQSTVLRLLIHSFQNCTESYVSEIFSLFNHLYDNYEFGTTDKISVGLRRLLNGAFPLFSDEQQLIVIRKILDLRLQNEFRFRVGKFVPNKELNGSRYGLAEGLFLLCLPKSLSERPEIKKRSLEIKRRFPDLKEYVGNNYLGPARQTLTERAYEMMNEENWLKSFRTYTGKKNEKSLFKGGKTEHAERYQKILKTGIQPYLSLIRRTVYDNEIPMTYAIKGLSAMQENNFPINELLKHLLTRIPDSDDMYYFIELLYDAIQEENCDEVLLDYLIEQVIYPFVKAKNLRIKEREKVEKGNLVSTRAATALVHVKDKKVKSKVFNALRLILSDGSSKSRSAVLSNFAYLMSLDAELTASLFTNTVNKLDKLKEMEEISTTLSYLVNYKFQPLLPFFYRALNFPEISDLLIQNLTNILMSCWYYKYPGAEECFMAFYERHEIARAHALDIATENFYGDDDKPSLVSYKIINMSMDDSSGKVSRMMSIKFLRIEHIKFKDFEPILSRYVYAKSFRIGDYFINYLTTHVAEHPEKCVQLFEAALDAETRLTEEELDELRYHNSPAKFIIAAYNVLENEEAAVRYNLLILFDRVLKDDRFRAKTSEMLETLID